MKKSIIIAVIVWTLISPMGVYAGSVELDREGYVVAPQGQGGGAIEIPPNPPVAPEDVQRQMMEQLQPSVDRHGQPRAAGLSNSKERPQAEEKRPEGA